MVQIAPSILSANFSDLRSEIDLVTRAGAHALHIDVMDGHFVPNITIGPPVVASIKQVTRLPLDVHLMINDPDKFIPAFIKAGADRLSVHIENGIHIHRTISSIKSAGVKAGVAVNPGTPPGTLYEILPILDFILVMSVNPGFGGQKFIESSIDKIRRLNQVITTRKLKTIISVDGGVDVENTPMLVQAGARLLVAGNAIFGAPDPFQAVKKLIEASKTTKFLKNE
ncbi:ribulose-phosphate 3-epimerase [bacterium]|nr:ribulose-phosphate 3-epimerase [candidate division CSSED10-310 bacterium]